MELIKARLHLHSKQSPGKLNYKSFIKGRHPMCVFCFILAVSGSYSVPLYAYVWAVLRGRGGGRQSHFSCPWQPMAFAKLSPLHLSSSFHSSSLFFSRPGLLLLLSPLPPFVTNTTALSMSNPLETAWGSQYGANRFFAFTVELLRQGRQTQLKLSRTAQTQLEQFFLI